MDVKTYKDVTQIEHMQIYFIEYKFLRMDEENASQPSADTLLLNKRIQHSNGHMDCFLPPSNVAACKSGDFGITSFTAEPPFCWLFFMFLTSSSLRPFYLSSVYDNARVNVYVNKSDNIQTLARMQFNTYGFGISWCACKSANEK